jgi:DNA-binding transcriptional LysR family regulator
VGQQQHAGRGEARPEQRAAAAAAGDGHAERAQRHPAVLLGIHEHEPDEAIGLLADDAVDLALTYDYNLAPARFDRSLIAQPLSLRQWGLGTPTAQGRVAGTALEVFRRFADHDWIVNSRNSGDEEVIRTVASLAGFQPRITHRVDSLELVQDMILAGLGVGLLPAGRLVRRGVVLRTLGQPDVTQRPFAVTRRGRSAWPPLALVLQLLGEISGLFTKGRLAWAPAARTRLWTIAARGCRIASTTRPSSADDWRTEEDPNNHDIVRKVSGTVDYTCLAYTVSGVNR